MLRLITFISIIIIFFPLNISGQTDLKNEISELEELKHFQSSPLVIRLRMKEKTRQAYENRISSSKDPDEIEGFKSALHELEVDRGLYKQGMLNAFAIQYFFSPVYFIHDYDFNDFISGRDSLVFDQNENLVDLKFSSDLYFMIQGDHNLHWMIKDHALNPMPERFPDEYKVGAKRILSLLAGWKDTRPEDLNKVAATFNKRLMKYADKLR